MTSFLTTESQPPNIISVPAVKAMIITFSITLPIFGCLIAYLLFFHRDPGDHSSLLCCFSRQKRGKQAEIEKQERESDGDARLLDDSQASPRTARSGGSESSGSVSTLADAVKSPGPTLGRVGDSGRQIPWEAPGTRPIPMRGVSWLKTESMVRKPVPPPVRATELV